MIHMLDYIILKGNKQGIYNSAYRLYKYLITGANCCASGSYLQAYKRVFTTVRW
jgi:hypothetical protein